MQASTWNDTNQHWIPRFLLKGFGIKGRASHVYVLDTLTGAVGTRSVADVASKQALLTERDDELMKGIEVHAARVIDRIRKEKLEVKRSDREALDALVYAMMQNDPYSGIDGEKTRQEIVDKLSKEVVAAFRRQGGLVDPQGMKEYVEERFNHDYLSVTLTKPDNMVLRALHLMGLSTHVPASGEFLVIGDSPVLIDRATANGVVNLMNFGSQVILPIHSRRVLLYSWETPTNLIQSGDALDREQVRSLNRDYFHASDSRYIFGRSPDVLKQTKIPPLISRRRVPSSAVSEGWLKMQSELVNASRSRAEWDAEKKSDLRRYAQMVVQNASKDADGQGR